MDENVTAFDSAKSSVEYAYNESLSLIRHSADSVGSYISSHPIHIYSDTQSFRTAVETLRSAVGNEISVRIGDALNGFNVRVSNIGYDFNKSSPTSEQVTELTSIVSDRADRLQELAQSVASNADSLVVEHSQNRPLMRPTGRRELPPSIAFDSPISFKYEFQNVGSLPWSGWMIIKLTDQYRNSVSVDYAPPSIPTLPPGDSSMLSRDIIVPKVVYKDGEPRSWGDKTTVKVSIHTRLSP